MFSKIKQAYKNKKPTLIKNAIALESFRLNFDFNMMFSLYAKHNDLKLVNKDSIFLSQIINLNNINIFKTYLNYIATNLKDIFNPGNLDFFYSIKGEVGSAHKDPENVIILGIKNITYYHIKDNDLQISPGDVLYIPKNILHHAFSSRERIVLSLSLWEK